MSHHLHRQHTDKELWWKAALQGVYFSQATINVTPAVLPLLTDNWVIPFHCMALLTTKWSLSLHAFIDNWMIPFTAWLYWQLNDPFRCMPLLTTEWSLSLHGFIDNWVIPFTAYTTAEIPKASQRAGQTCPLNCPFLWGISTLTYYVSRWAHKSQPPNQQNLN